MANHSFRCYAYRRAEERYFAYCLDLMLAGEGPTMEAAIADLDEAILAHVEAAYKRGWEEELIPRPARPGRWLEFYWLLLSYPRGDRHPFGPWIFTRPHQGQPRCIPGGH